MMDLNYVTDCRLIEALIFLLGNQYVDLCGQFEVRRICC